MIEIWRGLCELLCSAMMAKKLKHANYRSGMNVVGINTERMRIVERTDPGKERGYLTFLA